jgi:hypothetical protein
MFSSKNSIAFCVASLFLLLAVSFTSSEAQCVAPPSGMTNWWPADGNTFDIIGGQHGTLQNGAGFAAGKVGQAFSLDGEDDFVLVPNDPKAAFNFTGSFSIDAWIFLADNSKEFSPIVSKWNDIDVNNRSYFLAIDNARITNQQRLRFDVSQDGLFAGTHSSIRTSTDSIPLNAWTHVAAVFDASVPNLHVYINGVLNDGPSSIQSSVTTPFVNNEPLLIGAGDLGSDARDFFDGRIDEVELFDRPLTAAEVESIFNAGDAGKIAPIVIDIKPGSFPNSINLGSMGNVPVAVLSTETFDATTLDVASISFAGAPVITKRNGTFQASFEDVNGDGLLDLVLHFSTQALSLNSSSTEATLTGSTDSGRCVTGTDSVNIVPRRKFH